MAVEGQRHCSIEQGHMADFTVAPRKGQPISSYAEASLGVFCNEADNAGMSLASGNTDFLVAKRVEVNDDSTYKVTPIDPKEPMPFSGRELVVISSTLETNPEVIVLQHIDPHLPHSKRVHLPHNFLSEIE